MDFQHTLPLGAQLGHPHEKSDGKSSTGGGVAVRERDIARGKVDVACSGGWCQELRGGSFNRGRSEREEEREKEEEEGGPPGFRRVSLREYDAADPGMQFANKTAYSPALPSATSMANVLLGLPPRSTFASRGLSMLE